jgi:integrase
MEPGRLRWRNGPVVGRRIEEPGTARVSIHQRTPRILQRQGATADELIEKRIVVEHAFFNPETGLPLKDFRKSWRNACLNAGLAESEEIGKSKTGKPILKIRPLRIPHDFRRTAVRALVRAGVPEKIAMTMTGHKTRSVFERYNITSGADLKDAAAKLDKAAENLTVTVPVTVEQKAGNSARPASLPYSLTTSNEMPGAGIEPARPFRGSGF